jgi:hypothetical protein
MDKTSDHDVARYRASVEDAFFRLCDAMAGACAGLGYESHTEVAIGTGALSWHVHKPEEKLATAHAVFAREAAEHKALALYEELVRLFPQVEAYQAAPWARPGVALAFGFHTADNRTAALDTDDGGPAALRSLPQMDSLRIQAHTLSRLWSIPLVWPNPGDDAGVWEMPYHQGGEFKPRFWAPDAASAQLVGTLLWEPKRFQDWLSGQPLVAVVRKLPGAMANTDTLRTFLR